MKVIVVIAAIVLVILGIWSWLYAPCWMYGLSQPNDTPLRCWR